MIPLKGENQGSIALAHNPVFYSRTKHIDIQLHYIRDEVASPRIELFHVPTEEMIADGLTKALTSRQIPPYHRADEYDLEPSIGTATVIEATRTEIVSHHCQQPRPIRSKMQ